MYRFCPVHGNYMSVKITVYRFCPVHGNYMSVKITVYRFCTVHGNYMSVKITVYRFCPVHGNYMSVKITVYRFCPVHGNYMSNNVQRGFLQACQSIHKLFTNSQCQFFLKIQRPNSLLINSTLPHVTHTHSSPFNSNVEVLPLHYVSPNI